MNQIKHRILEQLLISQTAQEWLVKSNELLKENQNEEIKIEISKNDVEEFYHQRPEIDFSGFDPLLGRIQAVIQYHYKAIETPP